jgi:hypothetical protein
VRLRLQSSRALAVSDANGRAALFLGTVSSTLIALAFIGNISHIGTQLGTAFYMFALVLFPALFFLWLVTFDSVLQSAIQDRPLNQAFGQEYVTVRSITEESSTI